MTQQFSSQQSFVRPLQLSQTNDVSNPNTASFQGKDHLPAFLNKLCGMVNAKDTDPWVYWNEQGTSFIIPNSQSLAEQVLGRHFKHNRFASFVRQLNMYGFHKVPHLNHGVLHDEGLPEVWEFTNEHFRRDDPKAMRFIVRKKGEAEKARSAARYQTPPSPPAQRTLSNSPDLAIVRAEVQELARRQHLIKEELNRISASTEKLWECALETRLQYQKQEDKIEKMIKFLSEVFMKRAAEVPNKVRGLLEGPNPFEELSEPVSSAQTPLSPEAQIDVMKMFSNSKLPVGWFEALQQQLASPVSMTAPAPLDSSDALTMFQTAQNYDQTGQLHGWNDEADQRVDNLGGLASSANDIFSSSEHFQYFTNPNQYIPTSDAFAAQYVNLEDMQGMPEEGRKRAFEDQGEIDFASPKKTRVQ
jgi:hypothetical protein